MKNLRLTIQKELSREYSEYKTDIDKAIQKVLSQGRYILGKELERFEERFADLVGTKYAVGVGNGFDAIYISLMMIEPDLVYISHMKHKSAENAILLSLHTYTEKIEVAKIMIQTIAPNIPTEADYGKIVIEDACQSIGMKRKVPDCVFTSCYSFHPLKLLHCYGDGGAIAMNDKSLYKKIIRFRNHGRIGKSNKYGIGVNSRLDEVQAAVLNVMIDKLIKKGLI
jgi:dTDP-4-amino-4,6-dideoxygalactose transaminase